MIKFITPFLILLLIAVYLFSSTNKDTNDESSQKGLFSKEKVELKMGDPTSTFSDLEKKLKEDDVLVTVNGKSLTLKEAKENAKSEILSGDSRQEKYLSENEVQREISQFISYVVFYDKFPVAKEELEKTKEETLQSLVKNYGEDWGEKYLPDDEVIKYQIAEKRAKNSDATIDLEKIFRDSINETDIQYYNEVIEVSMKNTEHKFLKDFL